MRQTGNRCKDDARIDLDTRWSGDGGDGFVAPALAQVGDEGSEHAAWGTYATPTTNGKVCYVLSRPTDMQPKQLDHGDIFFTVSQKPEQERHVTSRSSSPPTTCRRTPRPVIQIGDKSFEMFIRGNYAWVANAAEEPILVAAMKAGQTMKVSAKSKRGNATSYVFSLKGISAALDSIATCK